MSSSSVAFSGPENNMMDSPRSLSDDTEDAEAPSSASDNEGIEAESSSSDNEAAEGESSSSDNEAAEGESSSSDNEAAEGESSPSDNEAAEGESSPSDNEAAEGESSPSDNEAAEGESSPSDNEAVEGESSPSDNEAEPVHDKEVMGSMEDLHTVKERLQKTVEILVTWKNIKPEKRRKSRAEYIEQLANDVTIYYGYNKSLADYFIQLLGPTDAISFFEASDAPRPMCLRTNMLLTRRRDLAKVLIARGANVDPIADWTKVGLKVIESSVPIGATPEYCGGHYMLQSASSFLPVMALSPEPGELVLDMAAAPGGKSTYIGQLMKNSGVLFCNEWKKERCSSLVANLHRLGITNSVILNMDGAELPKHLCKLDRVLLDAPCTGLGVISRDPSVKSKREPKDFKEAGHLQKVLLRAAVDLVNPNSPKGGIIVYSTCSLSVEENEEVVNYILKVRHVKVVPMNLPLGEPGLIRYREKRFHPSIAEARRIYPHLHNLDGFFVCKLKKLSDTIPTRVPRDRSRSRSRSENNHQTNDIEEGSEDES